MPEKVSYEMSLNDLVSGKLDHAEQSAQKFESRLGHVKGALANLGERALAIGETLGISFAFYKLAEFTHAGIEAAHALGQAEAQLKAGIISTNYAAGISYEELEESAKKFAAVLPYTRAQIVDMQSQLITFPRVTAKTFDEASQVILDMSTRLHRGLDETAIQVGKALQDPIKGVTALRRVGVNFNEEQTKILKTLVQTGHAGQAQALILKELQTEFAGSARAAAEADPLFRYNKLMGSLKMAIGETGEALLHDLTPGLEFAASVFKQTYEAGKQFFGYLKANGPAILKEVKNDAIAVAWGVGIAGTAFTIAYPQVLIYTGALIANGIASAGLAVVSGVLTAAQWALNVALTANPVGLVVVAIGALVTGLIVAYRHSEKFRAVLSGLGEIAKDIGGIFKGLGEQIIGALTFNPSMVMKGFEDMARSFHDVGSAFHRGYTQSMAESALEESREKSKSTIGEQVDKHKPIKPGPQTKAGTTTTSKVTGTKTLNIHINIGNIIKEFTIKTTNIKEGAQKAQDMVSNALLSSISDAEMATDV